MKPFFSFLLVFSSMQIVSQNLVSNSSFEDYHKEKATSSFTNSNYEFIKEIKEWGTPNIATPDLIHLNFKTDWVKVGNPKTGNNMIGLRSDLGWCEYIQIQLDTRLIPGKSYYAEFWARRGKKNKTSLDFDQLINKNFGILFLEESMKSNTTKMLDGKPQINASEEIWITPKEWVKISGIFTPEKSYKFICLGQFWNNSELLPVTLSGYFLLDDVIIKEIQSIDDLENMSSISKGTIIPIDDLLFHSGTSIIENEALPEMEKVVSLMNNHKALKVRINGHTDSKGNKKTNQKLSEERAQVICELLINRGIEKNRVSWKGFGEEKPISDNQTDEGRRKNRRVEIEIKN